MSEPRTEAEKALGLLLLPIRDIDAGEPPERSIPTQHEVRDIRQARMALARLQDTEPHVCDHSGCIPREVARSTIEHVLRSRARGGVGLGLNADLHEEEVSAAILAALSQPQPRPAEPEEEGIVQKAHTACCWCGEHHEEAGS
jgi:hypothetical protein